MSELQTMLEEMVARLLTDVATQPEPWPIIEEFGLTRLMLPETLNGFNGSWQDARIVFELLGQHALPLQVGETIIAQKYLYQTNLDIDQQLLSGIIGIGYCDNVVIDNANQVVSGTLLDPAATSYNGPVNKLLIETICEGQPHLLLVDANALQENSVLSEATIFFSGPLAKDQPNLLSAGALLRSLQICGALTEALRLTIQYANERSQFGRPLAKFQAIQHDLARLAEQTAAVQCATQAACQAADYDAAPFEIAAAKLRANLAVPDACSIAHQVHGAIGFTEEHVLHHFTRRLSTWRSEFGNDRLWSNTLGKLALADRDSTIWQFLTARGDAISESNQ